MSISNKAHEVLWEIIFLLVSVAKILEFVIFSSFEGLCLRKVSQLYYSRLVWELCVSCCCLWNFVVVIGIE